MTVHSPLPLAGPTSLSLVVRASSEALPKNYSNGDVDILHVDDTKNLWVDGNNSDCLNESSWCSEPYFMKCQHRIKLNRKIGRVKRGFMWPSREDKESVYFGLKHSKTVMLQHKRKRPRVIKNSVSFESAPSLQKRKTTRQTDIYSPTANLSVGAIIMANEITDDLNKDVEEKWQLDAHKINEETKNAVRGAAHDSNAKHHTTSNGRKCSLVNEQKSSLPVVLSQHKTVANACTSNGKVETNSPGLP